MCEIKFYSGPFKVSKAYYSKILERQTVLSEMVSPKIAIHSTLITTFGLHKSEYSSAFVDTIVMDDLFRA